MYNYKSLTKAQLIELVDQVESLLEKAVPTARDAAKEYSPELQSQLAFEVGHLGGYIKQTIALIQDYKNC